MVNETIQNKVDRKIEKLKIKKLLNGINKILLFY